ncbi:uncharacterized protein [Macrobrachium rosenbergii]|uniref:uncharacterized protein n=1 Tax=Macrobrachium rosenbergii TaxID=79674 RepID=UPI0034D649DA
MESIMLLLNMTALGPSNHLDTAIGPPQAYVSSGKYSSIPSSPSNSGLSSASLHGPLTLPRKVARFVVVSEGQYDHEHHTHHGEQHHVPVPHFTSGNTTADVFLGATATLDCTVHDLTNESVSWLRRVDDKLELLTWGSQTYSNDNRYSLVQASSDKWQRWQLVIRNVQLSDGGQYRCQVATQPPMLLTTLLNVTEPRVRVVDERGTKVLEKHYNSGSMIELKCIIEFVPFPHGPVTWKRGNKTLAFNTSIGGISVKGDAETGYIRSRLYVANATPRHSGVYSCWYSNYSSDTVTVHVIAGENSAGLQHDSHPEQPTNGGTSIVHVQLRYHFMDDKSWVIIPTCLPFGMTTVWTEEGCLAYVINTWLAIWHVLKSRWCVSLFMCVVHLAAHYDAPMLSSHR